MAEMHNPVPVATAAAKKSKPKSSGSTKEQEAIAHRISELEGIKVGEREQDIEIDRQVKKASREFSSTLSSMDNMAKLQALTKRSNDLLTSLKRLERELARTKRQRDQAQKERDSSKSELHKMSSKKEALEKLSRDTTTEVKKLRTDLQQCQTDDARNRQLLHDRLQAMVLDVRAVIKTKQQMRDYSETQASDEIFRAKFKSFVDQYELRELHSQSLLRAKDLELAHQTARLDHQKRVQQVESSRSSQLTRQVSNFSQTESELRSQLNIYVEKFKQVEDTLNSSNDLFLTFRREMEDMSKKTKRLEKENSTLTRKHDAMNANIIKMAEERTRLQRDMQSLRRRNDNLEKLCRGMQAQGRAQPFTTQREHLAGQGQLALDDQANHHDTQTEDDDDEDNDDEEEEDEEEEEEEEENHDEDDDGEDEEDDEDVDDDEDDDDEDDGDGDDDDEDDDEPDGLPSLQDVDNAHQDHRNCTSMNNVISSLQTANTVRQHNRAYGHFNNVVSAHKVGSQPQSTAKSMSANAASRPVMAQQRSMVADANRLLV